MGCIAELNEGWIVSANVGIRRIRDKCCGLFDMDYLSIKIRPMAFRGGYPTISRFETAPTQHCMDIAGLT